MLEPYSGHGLYNIQIIYSIWHIVMYVEFESYDYFIFGFLRYIITCLKKSNLHWNLSYISFRALYRNSWVNKAT